MLRKRGSEEQCVLFAEMRQDALLLFCCAIKRKGVFDMTFEFDFFKDPSVSVPETVQKQLQVIHDAAYNDSGRISLEEWEEDRRHGFGGSDIAALTGDSPFCNNWMLFLDKTHMAKQDFGEDWFRLQYGHATEALVAELFARKFSARVINETGMFKHPDYDFIRANLDRLAVLPTGELVILECKTTNPFAKNVWTDAPPLYYQWQGRQYLCVINAILRKAGLPLISKVYYSALYGNVETEAVYRKITLDPQLEGEMVELEKQFWLEHIIPRKLPAFNGTGQKFKEMNITYRMELAELCEAVGKALTPEEDESAPIALDDAAQAVYMDILKRESGIKALKAEIKALEEEVGQLEGELVAALHGNDRGVLPCGVTVALTTKNTRKSDFDKLHELYPEAYQECIKEGVGQPSLTYKKPSKSAAKKKAAEDAAKEVA